MLDFKVNQNIWLNIQVLPPPATAPPHQKQDTTPPQFHLKDLIVCEYRYKVLPQFILFPRLAAAELVSLKGVSFSELMERSKLWDKQSPILPRHELSMTDDLTDNEIIIRQINAVHVLSRNLNERLKQRPDTPKDSITFAKQYYGEESYWERPSCAMRIVVFIFSIIYLVQSYCLRIMLFALAPLPKLNLVV